MIKADNTQKRCFVACDEQTKKDGRCSCLTNTHQTLQLQQTGVGGSSLKPSDLIEFAKWINDKGYSHRLKIVPNDLIDFYLQNKENIIKANSENCH